MILNKLSTAGSFWFEVLFKKADSQKAKWTVGFLLTILFAGGMLHWGFLLDWFNNQFDVQDWHLHVGPYLDFLSKSLRGGEFPMHADSPYMLPAQYLARQNRPLSPQILLLIFMTPAVYVMVNVWIFYALGFWGLMLLRKKYQWSFTTFLFVFLLFNLNGHIVAHLGAGHFEWVGYFLLPFYVLLVLKMLAGEPSGWNWLLAMSLVMTGILLQGAAHFFIYCAAFLFLLALFRPRLFLPILKALVLSGMAGMIRILPPAIQFAGGTGLESLGGFESVKQLLEMFIISSSRGYWEKTYFLGLLGLAFVLYFGIIRKSANPSEDFRALYLPSLVMLFFSIGLIYSPLFNSGIPFLDSQRAPTRFLIVPLVFMIVLAGIRFQAMLDEWSPQKWEGGLAFLFAGGLMTYDLLINSRVWSLVNASDSGRLTQSIEVNLAHYPDPAYTTVLVVGSIFSLLTFLALIFLAYRERRTVV